MVKLQSMSRLRLPGDGVEALGYSMHTSKVMIAVDSTCVHGYGRAWEAQRDLHRFSSSYCAANIKKSPDT